MKINRLRASFGNLNNDTITFHDGLNVVYAPNESGKSTWCAFIRAMLYGIDSSERQKSGHIPDRQRYAPWSGVPMQGTMEITANKCEITLTRQTTQKSAPMRDFTATYTGSNIPVDGMTGTNAGEMLTGVTKDVFRRSAFVEQGAAAVNGSPELEKRILSIISTGEEDTSYSEASERLRSWQRERRYSRRGLIPDLEAGIEDGNRKIDAIEEAASGIIRMKSELEDAEQECSQLEQDVKDARRRQREEIVKNLSEARGNVKKLGAEQNAALEEANGIRNTLRNSIFGSRALQDVEEEAEGDLAKLELLYSRKSSKNSPLLLILSFLLTIAGALVYEKIQNTAILVVTAFFCLATLVLLMFFAKRRREINETEAAIRGVLQKYGASDQEKITEKLDEYHALNISLKKAEEREHKAKEKFDTAAAVLEKLENSVLGELDSSADSESSVLWKKLSERRNDVIRLSNNIASETGRLMTMGDPLVLGADIKCMEEELRVIRNEYDAISLAIDTLKDADDEIQSRFSPELGRIASEYMSEVTGGRYEEIFLNKDFSARARTRNDSVARESEYLSAGTYDLLYLAVRLAVCELALPEGETCPLIIDDALVNLDQERFDQAMNLLREISKDRQVILFTCRK